MTKKNTTTFSKLNKIYLILLLLAILIMALSGCKEKAQAPAPVKVTGTCEVFDKLPNDIAKSVEVNYRDKVKFLGITINKLSENKLKIFYYWQFMDELGPYNKAFVIFSDKDNKQLFGNDHDFCPNKPFEELKGKFIKETYVVDFPASAMGKKVNVGIGIFAPELKTDARLKITSAGKTPLKDVNSRAIVEEIIL